MPGSSIKMDNDCDTGVGRSENDWAGLNDRLLFKGTVRFTYGERPESEPIGEHARVDGTDGGNI